MRSWILLVCLLHTSTGVSYRETCQSLECVTLAAGMASKMNMSADPCEDFYNYACGNFPGMALYNPRRVRPLDQVGQTLIANVLDEMTEKIEKKVFEMLVLPSFAADDDPSIQELYNLTRMFFLSCTEFLQDNSESKAHAFMKGMFDHLMRSIERGNQTLESIMAALVRTGGGTIIQLKLPVGVLYDAFHKNSNLSEISRAEIGIIRPSQWSSKGAIWFSQFVDYLKSNDIVRRLDLSRANETHRSVSEFLVNASVRFPDYQFDQLTLSELDAKSARDQPGDAFSWSLFFEELLDSPIDSNAKVDIMDVNRTIYILNYFKKQPVYSNGGSMLSPQVSYFILHWLISYGDFLPSKLRSGWKDDGQETHLYSQFIFKPTTGRVEGCMELTISFLQPIVERMYKSTYHPKTFKGVRDLVHLIKRASSESVRRQTWITRSGQDAIIEKIKWVKHSIGFEALKRQQLKEIYNKTLYTLRTSSQYLSESAESFGSLMSIALCASAQKNFVYMSGQIPVTAFAGSSALDVNAYNYIGKNRIVFPMAILEPPVYHPGYPDYIKLGSLGYIIGHEIGHSFDDIGHTLNRQGALGHFWDNDTESAYLKRIECVRNSFSNYSLYPGGPTLNSTDTLGNDIADIMGIQAAYNTLQLLKQSGSKRMPNLPTLPTELNQEQLFFVQAAQSLCTRAERKTLVKLFSGPYASHSAGHLRVRGMMENSEDFARTFRCKRSQGMHPKREKCTFW